MNKRSNYAWRAVRFYWNCLQKYPGAAFGEILTMPFIVLVSQLMPSLIVADILRKLSSGNYANDGLWGGLGSELILYAALVASGGLFLWRLLDYFMWKLEANVQRDIANRVFSHLTQQSADFHANHFSGSLVSDTNKLIGSFVRFSDTTMFNVIPLVSNLVFTSVILVTKVPYYVLALNIFAGMYMIVAFKVTRQTRKLSEHHAASESKQTGFLADAITNIMVVKSFAKNKYENIRFQKVTQETRNRLMTFAWAFEKQQVIYSAFNSTILALSLTIGVISVVRFKTDVGVVFLIVNYTGAIAMQLIQFSNNVIRNYNRAFADAKKMLDILDTAPEVQDPQSPEAVRITRGGIELRDVVFTHAGTDKPLFDGLNIRIKPGEKVGLVGHSGSGKTTLTRLLLRFSDINAGEILIDGQNIAAITQDDLHSNISYVPQEPMLFHREIRENIAYGTDDADDKTIENIAKAAHVHDFVSALPDGYHTLVGERGIKLSGGQRQRVAIARAMLKNAPILVLDEATSALDSESEQLIQDALWKLMEGRTAIVIAHRLSTIQKMDRIIVLEDGKIVEQGSHKELIRMNGQYANLWERQSGGFIED